MTTVKGKEGIAMIQEGCKKGGRTRPTGIAPLVLLTAFVILLTACSQKPQETSQPVQPAQSAQPAQQRYHLVGKIVSVNPNDHAAVIDHQAIPGFMGAMTMSYPIAPSEDLSKIGAGDEITADVVTTADGFHIENIVVTKKGANSKPTTELHIPRQGDRVPNFALTNQDGKPILLSSYKGDVLLVTFVYTQCPFPDYCPLVSRNFAKIYAATQKDPAISTKVRLLTISFDPAHDTPEVLRKYAATFRQITGRVPFDRWEFATASPKEMDKITNFFGMSIGTDQGQIVHSMSTSVISPEGRIYKWYDENGWAPADLVQDANEVLQGGDANSATQAHAQPGKVLGPS
jgi:protein SCO1